MVYTTNSQSMPGGFNIHIGANGQPNRLKKTIGSVKVLMEISFKKAQELVGKKARPFYHKKAGFSKIVKVRDTKDMIIAYLKNGMVINIDILEIIFIENII